MANAQDNQDNPKIMPDEANGNDSNDSLRKSGLECAICLQICIHPVRLPCRHIFCYLCVKGTANQSKKCAMCRQEIPHDYLDKPELVEEDEIESFTVFENGYQWFYEGRNGWWQYDDRTSTELEIAFKKGDQRCEVLVAGFLYIIDFQHLVQMRRNDPSRRRRIKRDLVKNNMDKKGVAGIRIPGSDQIENPLAENTTEPENEIAVNTLCNLSESARSVGTQNEQLKTSNTTPATPTNTPQTPNFGGDMDTSVPSSPGRNSVLVDVDRSLVQALRTLRMYDPQNESGNNLDAQTRNSRHQTTRIEPWDVNLTYSDEEEL